MNNIVKWTLKALLCSSLVSCASMYGSPDNRLAENRAKSDYELCRQFVVGTLAPPEIRGEWAMELRRRGVSCGEYAAGLNAESNANQALISGGAQVLSGSNSGYAPSSGGVTCFQKRQWVSGFNRNCVYDCLGSETVQTIASTSNCPLNIRR